MAVYNHSFVFEFEQQYDRVSFREYMQRHWRDSFIYSAVYVLVVFSGKKWMENRPRYELRPYLALWSALLGVFSIFGAVRTVPELVSSVRDYGMEYSLCNPVYLEGVTGFWCCMFAVSKVYELGDTIFIVLRKQQLIFLHWYHHITVLIYVWYMYPANLGFGRWFMGMNYTVHSIMYTYYAVRAMKFQVPKFVSMIITILQLSQMIAGFVVTYMTYLLNLKGIKCSLNDQPIKYGMIMYGTYFILFAHFFYSTYIAEKPRLHTSEITDGKKMS
ncbi:elongation of very long chain fatty acids protein 6-like [Mizuhopecten yessoensis]|uniref:Elongation of very long chain fatty acids protein n=1 Tax=Mizuhopecten yessoensis TaxID=6573 RepID=A0A210QGZ5_MIZYE|nr:elongation of very long chain fatty acids protein 6-like [Mizuhopecten yessoensis]OWF47969.1 Elongation of very long chain fatty acids protein 6 [Mizuhopecten yessoensis]